MKSGDYVRGRYLNWDGRHDHPDVETSEQDEEYYQKNVWLEGLLYIHTGPRVLGYWVQDNEETGAGFPLEYGTITVIATLKELELTEGATDVRKQTKKTQKQARAAAMQVTQERRQRGGKSTATSNTKAAAKRDKVKRVAKEKVAKKRVDKKAANQKAARKSSSKWAAT